MSHKSLILVFILIALHASAASPYGSATYSGLTLTTATSSASVSASNSVTVTSSTVGKLLAVRSSGTGNLDPDTWHQNLISQAFIFEGNSITASPNGAGVTSYAGIIQSGTYPQTTWFNGNGTVYDDAVGGSVISNGTTGAANAPQTVNVAAFGLSATTLFITSGAATQTPGYMSVTGTGIGFPTSGTLTSGTILTLSSPTTASSGTEAIILGGNNIMDRIGEAYPHRPSKNGGDGGPRAFLFMTDGGAANCLRVVESGTSIIQDILAVSSSYQALGFTVVISPTLPTGYRGGGPTWWTPTQEAQRQIVNTFVRRHSIPGALVVDMTKALSGEDLPGPADSNWTLFDTNGIHPIGYANAMLANFLNGEMVKALNGYDATPEVSEHPVAFNNPATFNSGIVMTSTSAADFSVLQPNLMLSNTSAFTFGVAEAQQQGMRLYFGYNAATGGGNFAGIGVFGGVADWINGSGQVIFGQSGTPAFLAGAGAGVISSGANADFTFYGTNSSASSQTTSIDEMPNLGTSAAHYAWHEGVNTSNDFGFDYFYAGSGSSSNWGGFNFGGDANPRMVFWKGGDAEIAPGTSTPTDNGFTLEVNGSERVNGALTVSGGISGIQKSIIRVAGTLTSGTAVIGNASISGSNCWAQDNATSLTNVGALTVTTSGTVATIRSTVAIDSSVFSLFIAP